MLPLLVGRTPWGYGRALLRVLGAEGFDDGFVEGPDGGAPAICQRGCICTVVDAGFLRGGRPCGCGVPRALWRYGRALLRVLGAEGFDDGFVEGPDGGLQPFVKEGAHVQGLVPVF